MLTKPVWVEIPVKDIERAVTFYGALFDKELEIVDEWVRRYANLASTDGGAGASINQTQNFDPSDKGTLSYFWVDGSLEAVLAKVKSAGGEVIIAKALISENADSGYYATFKDTEGNIIGLFSMS
jgi:predicted enzyme related to lactoylglutathione lyase